MMRKSTIRPSEDGDVPRLTAIYGHHVRHGTASFELEPPGEAEMARRRAAILSAGLPYLVAELDGTTVGYAYAGPYRPRPAYRFTVEDSVYLAPELTGRGIGAPLLARLIEAAATCGARQMVAVIGDSAQLPSIRLHERAGFRHVGTVRNVGWKFGRWLDTVILQRPLGAGAVQPPEPP